MTVSVTPMRDLNAMPDQTEPKPRVALSVDEVAALLGISRAKVCDAVRAGELPSLRFGRRVLIPARAFYELVGAAESFVPPDNTSPIASASASSAAGRAWA